MFLTCIGIPFAILMVMAGFAIMGAGFTIGMGGAAAGAGAGCLGIFGGATLMKGNSRKNKY